MVSFEINETAEYNYNVMLLSTSHNAVVVVVWFGDPCESPGALLLKAAPGSHNALQCCSLYTNHFHSTTGR